MEEREGREREPITVEIINKGRFCEIMNAIREQDLIAESVCESLSQIADIFAFDVNNRYRKVLEELLVYLFDDTGEWIEHWMYEAYWKTFPWWDEQGKEHTVSSNEELYDLLIENLQAHRAAKGKVEKDIEWRDMIGNED